MVAHQALGVAENDVAALRAMREIDDATATKLAQAIEARVPAGDPRPALVRAAAEACREASRVRRAAQAIRAGGVGVRGEDALGEDRALVRLAGLDLGERTSAARLVALVLAADRVEIARDLPPRARVRAIAGPLALSFGAAPPAEGAGGLRDDAFAALLEDAAKRGGHATTAVAGASVQAREAEALVGVAAAFADRFDGLTPTLGEEEGARVARGYALRLRQALEARRNRLAPSASGSAAPSASASAAGAGSRAASGSAVGAERR